MAAKTDKTTSAIPSSPAPAATPRRRLHPAVLRLLAVFVLFAGWIGYLVYQVVTLPQTSTGTPLILSRSQFLVSKMDVIARLDSIAPDAAVVIEEVLYPKKDAPLTVGAKVRVTNLGRCRPLPMPG